MNWGQVKRARSIVLGAPVFLLAPNPKSSEVSFNVHVNFSRFWSRLLHLLETYLKPLKYHPMWSSVMQTNSGDAWGYHWDVFAVRQSCSPKVIQYENFILFSVPGTRRACFRYCENLNPHYHKVLVPQESCYVALSYFGARQQEYEDKRKLPSSR